MPFSRITVSVLLLFLISVSMGLAPAAGAGAPDFTLPDINGNKMTLSSFRDKVVVLNFWATWCTSCKEEMTSLNNLYLKLKDKGFVVLAISIDTSEKPVRSFISEKKLKLNVLLDKEKEVYFDSYAVMGLPTSFLIDRNGLIVDKIVGEVRWDTPQMEEEIMKAIRK
jgi:peroxiredoxin